MWLLAALICALIVGWFIVGPGADSPVDESRPVRLVLSVPAGERDERIYRDVIHRFEARHPDVAVELRAVTGANFYQKVLVMMASGLSPDLIWMGEGFNEFAQKGAFL